MLPRFSAQVNASLRNSALFYAGFVIVGDGGMMRAPTTTGRTMDRATREAILKLPLTLQEMIRRKTTEEGECLLWTGSISLRDAPRCYCDYTGASKRPSQSLRRVLLEALAGRPLGKMVAVSMCGTRGCVNPTHLQKMSRKARMQRASALGTVCGPAVTARNSAIARKRRSLTDDQIRQILARRDDRQWVLAREFGVARSTIGNVLSGKLRPTNDVWSGVFARLTA